MTTTQNNTDQSPMHVECTVCKATAELDVWALDYDAWEEWDSEHQWCHR